ncbi:MAG: riboflavin synthase [Candidatus Gracilibacteria bacterium]|jgi:riboflavin synthase
MFTGIIKEVGRIEKIKSGKNIKTFTVKADFAIKDKEIGQSVAVNGVCVTITGLTKNSFDFDAMQETLERTNLGSLKSKSKVNLEPALTLNQSLDGHLVQGHVDTQGKTTSLKNDKKHTILTIEFPVEISKYLAFKGSITINGVSLTISRLEEKTFSVDLIPHTLAKTNLGELKKGDKINLEVDIIARYLKRMLDCKEGEFKYEYLVERGFI